MDTTTLPPPTTGSKPSGDATASNRTGITRLDWVLVGLAVLVLGYVVYRAVNLSMTLDESFTYTRAMSVEGGWAGLLDIADYTSANNHLLNSYLASISVRLLGSAEWAVRLPNVLAGVLYLLATIGIARRMSHWTISIATFLLLAFQPFLLDFFGIARGYGLTLGLMMACLYLTLVWRAGTRFPRVALLVASTLAGLALIANLTLVLFAAAWAAVVLVVQLLADRSVRDVGTRWTWWVRRAAHWLPPIAGPAFLAVLFVLPFVIEANAAGEFYVGGTTGVFQDTLVSLAHALTYGSIPSERGAIPIAIVLAIIPVGCLALAGYRIRRDRSHGFDAVGANAILVSGICLSVFAGEILLFVLNDTLYVLDRGALFLLPLLALSAVYGLECARGSGWSGKAVGAAVAALTLVVLVNAVMGANLGYTLIWRYDADTKDMARDLAADLDASRGDVRLATPWLTEPAVNYYRERYGLENLLPVDREENRLDAGYMYFCENALAPAENALTDAFSFVGEGLCSQEVTCWWLCSPSRVMMMDAARVRDTLRHRDFEILGEYPRLGTSLVRLGSVSSVPAGA